MNKFLLPLTILLLWAWDSREFIYVWQSQHESGCSFAFVIWILLMINAWVILENLSRKTLDKLISILIEYPRNLIKFRCIDTELNVKWKGNTNTIYQSMKL